MSKTLIATICAVLITVCGIGGILLAQEEGAADPRKQIREVKKGLQGVKKEISKLAKDLEDEGLVEARKAMDEAKKALGEAMKAYDVKLREVLSEDEKGKGLIEKEAELNAKFQELTKNLKGGGGEKKKRERKKKEE